VHSPLRKDGPTLLLLRFCRVSGRVRASNGNADIGVGEGVFCRYAFEGVVDQAAGEEVESFEWELGDDLGEILWSELGEGGVVVWEIDHCGPTCFVWGPEDPIRSQSS